MLIWSAQSRKEYTTHTTVAKWFDRLVSPYIVKAMHVLSPIALASWGASRVRMQMTKTEDNVWQYFGCSLSPDITTIDAGDHGENTAPLKET